MKEAEAVLEALAIADLCLERKRLIATRQLKFQFYHLPNRDVAGNGCADPAFTQILAAAVQDFCAANEQSNIQEESRECSGCAPLFFFMRTGNSWETPYHKP